MPESITVVEALERTTIRLDKATEELYYAEQQEEASEEAWDTVYDAVAETLEDEYKAAGRKTSPSKDTITSVARREHRVVYQQWRKAKRRSEKAQVASSNRRQQASAYQTLMNNLGTEARVQDYLSQRDGLE